LCAIYRPLAVATHSCRFVDFRYVCAPALFVLPVRFPPFYAGTVSRRGTDCVMQAIVVCSSVRARAISPCSTVRSPCLISLIFLRFCTRPQCRSRTTTRMTTTCRPCNVPGSQPFRHVSRNPRILSPVYQQRAAPPAPLQRCLSTPVVFDNPRPPGPHLAQWNAPSRHSRPRLPTTGEWNASRNPSTPGPGYQPRTPLAAPPAPLHLWFPTTGGEPDPRSPS
jgi:hypothetical protein